MRVLVVDDDEMALVVIKSALTQAGYEVVTARDGLQALQILSEGSCRLVVTDWMMPRMNGPELCRAVRQQHFQGYVYLILLTANNRQRQKNDGLAAGADDFISKPFDPAELVARVRAGERILTAGRTELQAEITLRRGAEEALKNHSQQQSVIAQFGQRALAGLELPALLEEAAAHVARTLDIEYCQILELLPDTQTMLLRAGVGLKPRLIGTATTPAGSETQDGHALHTLDPVVVDDWRSEKRYKISPLLSEHQIIAGASVVIAGHDRPFGALGAYSTRPRQFTPHDLDFLRGIANILALAIGHDRWVAALSESELRFRQITENINDAFWIISADGLTVHYVSPAYNQIWGKPSADLQHDPWAWLESVHPDDRVRVQRTFLESKTTPAYNAEFRIFRPDGSLRWISDRSFPIRDSAHPVTRLARITEDITDRKIAEQTLLTQQQNLESANRGLEITNRKLSELYQTAQRFVDNVSHEFRTPLTVIKGYSEAMRDELAGPVTDRQKEFLGFVVDRTRDLTQMVDDLLDTSKLRAGTLRIDRAAHAVKKILAPIWPMLKAKAAGNHIDLVQSLPVDLPEVFVDAEKIGRIIVNLVVNAIKFSPEGKRVTLWARPKENTALEIGITDEGPGIAPENLDLIFARFRQVGAAQAASAKGFGLGLNIARELAALNLGEISVASKLGNGSTFSFTMPLHNPESILRHYSRYLQTLPEIPLRLAALRLHRTSGENIESDLRGFIAASIRPDDLILPSPSHDSLLIIGCSSAPDAWLTRLQTASESFFTLPASKSVSDSIAIDPLGDWPFPMPEETLVTTMQELLHTETANV